MQKLIVIFGCNGSGKTSLAKNILKANASELLEISTNYGKYTKNEKENIFAVGKYTISCGGADSVKTVTDYFNIIKTILKQNKDCTIILEGALLSTIFNKPLKNFLELKYEYNVKINLFFLYVSLKTAFLRVYNRNGRIPKMKTIQAKQKGVIRNFKNFVNLGEFSCFVIDTEGKTADEVYDDFRKQYKV